MGSLTVEINMHFQIPPAQCGRCQTPRTNKLNHTPTLVQEGPVDRDPLLILILMRHLGSAIFDCNYFLKKTKKTKEINTKLSQNSYEVQKLANF